MLERGTHHHCCSRVHIVAAGRHGLIAYPHLDLDISRVQHHHWNTANCSTYTWIGTHRLPVEFRIQKMILCTGPGLLFLVGCVTERECHSSPSPFPALPRRCECGEGAGQCPAVPAGARRQPASLETLMQQLGMQHEQFDL